MATEVRMPQLGESVVEGTVGQWLINEGQPVQEFEPLLTVTTDKVDTEIPAPASGILLKVHVPDGQTVAAGTLLALIGAPGEVAPPPSEAPQDRAHASSGTAPHDRAEAPAATTPRDEMAPSLMPTPLAQRVAAEHGLDLSEVAGTGPGGRITREDVKAHLAATGGDGDSTVAPGRASPQGFISPAVARLAAEFAVDLSQVVGTGQGGRITKKDVMAYIAAPTPRDEPRTEPPPWEQPGTGSLFKPSEEMAEQEQAPQPLEQPARAVSAGVPGDSEDVPLSAMRRSIAKHMIVSRQTSAHVTTVMEVDMTRVVLAREKLKDELAAQGTRLTFTPFFLQAIVAGLRAVPDANSSFANDHLQRHRRMHIGVAVALPDGLIVPVIRDADEKSLLGLARAVNDLAERARARRLSPDDVQGGTFTLTNHGTLGSLFATPIINQPQAGILGVGAIQKRPVVISRGHTLLADAEDYIAIRPMAYLSFSFDHRILDGAGADRFLSAVKAYLEEYRG